MAAIETTALARCFGEFRAPSGPSLTVAESALLGILGPNGSGKRTAIELLTGPRWEGRLRR